MNLETNACAPSEPSYLRQVLKRMEVGNDGLQSLVSTLTSKMDAVQGSKSSELKDSNPPSPAVGCIMDEFEVQLNVQSSLLNRLTNEIIRLSKFL